MLLVHLPHHLRLQRPQQHVVTHARRVQRQRGAPRSAAQYADACRGDMGSSLRRCLAHLASYTRRSGLPSPGPNTRHSRVRSLLSPVLRLRSVAVLPPPLPAAAMDAARLS